MTPLVVLSALIIGPAVILALLRVNAAFIFLSLCLGDVLVQFVGNDATTVVGGAHAVSSNYIQLGLLLLPVVLTVLFMVRTVRGSRIILNTLPAVGVGLLLTLLVVPLMSPGLSANIVNSQLWHGVERSQDLIVGFSALVCLLFLWKQRPKSAGKEHAKH